MQQKRILSTQTQKQVGKMVKLSGWVHARRDHGKIIFIDLRDREGLVQLVFTPADKKLYKLADMLRSEWVISVVGKVNKRPKGQENPKLETGMVEVEVKDLVVLSEARTPPFPVDTDVIKAGLQKRVDWRWVDLRREKNRLIFEVWTTMEQAFRDYWTTHGYIQIHSPKLMSTPSESGAELFEVPYFGKKAYLAQSPQFYKQMAMAAGFEKVFEVGPVFRANPSFTSRHDTEFTSYDMEISFIDSHEDVIKAEEEMLVQVLGKIKEKHGEKIEKLYKRKLTVPKIPFPRVTMKEAKELLAKAKVSHKREGDLSPEEERELSEIIFKREKHEFVFVTDYPTDVRPFYHMRLEKNPKLTKSFDLLWNGLEITTGAQREHRYKVLTKQAKEKGLRLTSIRHYLDFFKYGCPPHGGFGLGPTRMLMKVFHIDNVREVTFLYRGVKRLTP